MCIYFPYEAPSKAPKKYYRKITTFLYSFVIVRWLSKWDHSNTVFECSLRKYGNYQRMLHLEPTEIQWGPHVKFVWRPQELVDLK